MSIIHNVAVIDRHIVESASLLCRRLDSILWQNRASITYSRALLGYSQHQLYRFDSNSAAADAVNAGCEI